MEAKEKAIELIDKFRIISYGKYSIPTKNKAKQCALIAVDTIIFELKLRNCSVKYFEEVKQEIELL
ncbi:hypothetical protein [Flavobacterium sp.]|uniref:hypothetical protein n=1 Tax=Flavobacterium sp. TaxID=239 RepID=UPI0033409BA9